MTLYQEFKRFVYYVWMSRTCQHEWTFPQTSNGYRKVCRHCNAERPWKYE